MMNQDQGIDTYSKSMQILHLAILIALVIFIGIAMIINQTEGALIEDATEQKQITDALTYIVPIVSLLGIFVGFAYFKKRLRAIRQVEDVATKLISYRGISVIRYAILEGAAFFGLGAFFLSGIIWFLPYPFLMIIIFILIRPTKGRITRDLMLEE